MLNMLVVRLYSDKVIRQHLWLTLTLVIRCIRQHDRTHAPLRGDRLGPHVARDDAYPVNPEGEDEHLGRSVACRLSVSIADGKIDDCADERCGVVSETMFIRYVFITQITLHSPRSDLPPYRTVHSSR